MTKHVLVIGIGPGDPSQVTMQAIEAMRCVDVFFVPAKRAETADLVRLRREICARYLDHSYRIVQISDPERDRTDPDYEGAVVAWHAARAERYGQAIDSELGPDGCGAFLVWGDPSLYDSTIRILEQVAAANPGTFDIRVIPGITSVQALAACHRMPLHGIGEAVHITTGRRLVDEGWPPGVDNVVVMLDGNAAFTTLEEDVDVFWGAYVGTPAEIAVSGRLRDVAEEIHRRRTEAREENGWILDIALLRRRHD